MIFLYRCAPARPVADSKKFFMTCCVMVRRIRRTSLPVCAPHPRSGQPMPRDRTPCVDVKVLVFGRDERLFESVPGSVLDGANMAAFLGEFIHQRSPCPEINARLIVGGVYCARDSVAGQIAAIHPRTPRRWSAATNTDAHGEGGENTPEKRQDQTNTVWHSCKEVW